MTGHLSSAGGGTVNTDIDGAVFGMGSSLLDLPPNVLDLIVKILPGNDRKPLRASCRELRCLANEATDFICIDVSDVREWTELQAVPSSLKAYIKTVRIVVPAKFVPCDFHETLATLDIASGRPDMQIQVVVGSAVDHFHSLPAIHVSQMVQCLARARIWQRVCHLSFACEQWLGPEVSFGPNVVVRAHIRLSERDSRVNRKLLRATLMQPGLTELTISDMLPQDLDADLVRMLSERSSTLTRLTLQVCDISEFDSDVPLIFDLRPLAQVLLPKLEHFAVESSTDVDARLLAVDGLPCMLSERCGPALKAVALKGVSQEPFSTQRASQRHRNASWLPHIPMSVPDFRPFSGLTALELSSPRLGNLALLPNLVGLERLVLRALEDGGNRRPRLRGGEFAGLPKLRQLVLDCIDCPHGLTSKSLEELELVNTDLSQVHAVTEHSRLPNVASVVVTERERYIEYKGQWRSTIMDPITKLFVQAATDSSPEGVSLPAARLPGRCEEHASKAWHVPIEFSFRLIRRSISV
ncbi:g11430 [Coccomyxa viridis]|uniref:G11430 protein n=1 Tax=Coccomyxa viridis TaxID=1274662 RepID=A0ABP1G7W1_9CHLO